MTRLDKSHNDVADMWRTAGRADFGYYERFEDPALLAWFWSEQSRFRIALERYLDLTDVLEIASGAGRHANQIASRCRHLALIDTSPDASALAKARFADQPQVEVVLSADGLTLPFEGGRFTAIYSYDAMVHFEPLTVAAYIQEISRTLSVGGRAVIHHSNYSWHPERRFDENPNWRNFMPKGMMAHLCSRNGLKIIEQQAFNWNRRNPFSAKTDAMTVVERIAQSAT